MWHSPLTSVLQRYDDDNVNGNLLIRESSGAKNINAAKAEELFAYAEAVGNTPLDHIYTSV